MKKHFLLLVMALMSMTAWAADLSKGSINAPSPYYGSGMTGIKFTVYNEQNIALKEVDSATGLGDFVFDGYFSDEACQNKVTFADVVNACGTTFWIKVTGANDYENSVKASFQIKKMPVDVVFKAKTKKYLKPDPAIEISKNTDDKFEVYDKDKNLITDEALIAVIQAAASRESGNDVKIVEGKPAPYKYTANFEDAKYTIGEVTGGLTIEPKDFIATGTSATVEITATANFTYNNQEQKATISVKDLATGEVISTDDYTVTYTNHKSAGTATATITPKRNYTGAAAEQTYTIKQAPLFVTPSATKVYDGANTLPNTFKATPTDGDVSYYTFKYQGFVEEPGKEPKITYDGTLTSSDATPNVNAAGYNLTAAKENFTVTGGNYYLVPQAGKFVITPLETLKVKVADNEDIPYGSEEKFSFTVTGGYVTSPDDKPALDFALKVVKTTDDKNAKLLTVDWKSDTEIENDVNTAVDKNESIADKDKAAKKAEYKAAAIAAKANYLLKDANITKGKYSYANATLMVALKESEYKLTKVYDGQNVPTIDVDTENGLLVNPVVEGLDLSKLKVTVVDNDKVEGTATVGTYRLELSGLDEIENYDITYVPSRFTITKRPLNITFADQTFVKGETLNLDKTMYTYVKGEDKGLASTDQASEVFYVKTGVAVDEDGKVSSTASDDYIFAIDPSKAPGATPSTVTKWANYDITQNQGNAKVIAAATKINTGAKIETKAEEGATVTIISDRVLNPEKWNAMVLPFEVSVAQLSNAFGYAVVNRLNTKATTKDNVVFSLEMKSIPENEPFLVKVVGNKAGSEYKALSLNGITFKDVNLVAAESTPVEAAGNIFTGVYEAKELLGPTYGFLYDDPTGARENKWWTPRNNAYTIQPLDAFLTYATAKAPVITVEDIDGTVTAIKSISAGEFQEMKAQGWYTLGGMKLQSAPTQKGVYINNGKKVVIK